MPVGWEQWYDPLQPEWNLESTPPQPTILTPLGGPAYTAWDAIEGQDAWAIDWIVLPGPTYPGTGGTGLQAVRITARTIAPGGAGTGQGLLLDTLAGLDSGDPLAALELPQRLNYRMPRVVVAPRILVESYGIDPAGPPPASSPLLSGVMQCWRLALKGKQRETQSEAPTDGNNWWELPATNDPPRRVPGPSVPR